MENYYIIDIEDSNASYPLWKNKRGVLWRIYLYYIIKWLPIKIEDTEYLGETGEKIILPFTKEEIESISLMYFEEFMNKIIKKTELVKCYNITKLNKEKEGILKEYYVPNNSILMYIMFCDILERLSYELNIMDKNLRIMIIDSGDRRIEYILESIGVDINYLTIITRRPEYFQEYIDMIYDTKGLVIQLEAEVIEEELRENIVINLSKEYYKSLRNAMAIIDMNQTEKKLQYYYSRRKNNIVIYNVLIESNGIIVDNQLLEYYLVRNYHAIRDVVNNNKYGKIMGIDQIKDNIRLKVKEIIRI